MVSRSALPLVICLASFASAQEPTKPQLTARELFYSATQPPAKAAPLKTQVKPAPPSSKKTTGTEIAATQRNAPAATPPEPAPPAALPDGAHIVPAVSSVRSQTGRPPLGLKYAILKKSGDGMVEVPADTAFHAGDRIQLQVETNAPGYLYIVSQGSSGTWKPMFPAAEVEDGNNHVEGFHPYLLPPKSLILFDEQTGNEKLFVVFSREPEPNLEKMIYTLKNGAPAPKTPAPKSAEPKTLVAMADARIDDRTVGILRTAYARDLVIEKVDEHTAGERKETAVYVVNPSGSSDSRVVADLQLAHR
jgi:hypothetical protein